MYLTLGGKEMPVFQFQPDDFITPVLDMGHNETGSAQALDGAIGKTAGFVECRHLVRSVQAHEHVEAITLDGRSVWYFRPHQSGNAPEQAGQQQRESI